MFGLGVVHGLVSDCRENVTQKDQIFSILAKHSESPLRYPLYDYCLYLNLSMSSLPFRGLGFEPRKTSIAFQDLPDNELYCPPITIRCFDCRNFGRFALVGTHVINNIQKFRFIPTTKTVRGAALLWGSESHQISLLRKTFLFRHFCRTADSTFKTAQHFFSQR